MFLFMIPVQQLQATYKGMITGNLLCLLKNTKRNKTLFQTEKNVFSFKHPPLTPAPMFKNSILFWFYKELKHFKWWDRAQKVTVGALNSIPFTASVKDLPFQAFALYLEVANAFQWWLGKEKKYHTISFFVENEEVMKEKWTEVRKREER